VLKTISRVTLEFQVFCRPALLKCHYICHDLTSTRTLSATTRTVLKICKPPISWDTHHRISEMAYWSILGSTSRYDCPDS
jgi:hypothetical protein